LKRQTPVKGNSKRETKEHITPTKSRMGDRCRKGQSKGRSSGGNDTKGSAATFPRRCGKSATLGKNNREKKG